MDRSQGGVINTVHCCTCCIQRKTQQVLQLMPSIELETIGGNPEAMKRRE